jgi:hypothetical protein
MSESHIRLSTPSGDSFVHRYGPALPATKAKACPHNVAERVEERGHDENRCNLIDLSAASALILETMPQFDLPDYSRNCWIVEYYN